MGPRSPAGLQAGGAGEASGKHHVLNQSVCEGQTKPSEPGQVGFFPLSKQKARLAVSLRLTATWGHGTAVGKAPVSSIQGRRPRSLTPRKCTNPPLCKESRSGYFHISVFMPFPIQARGERRGLVQKHN